MGGLIGLGGAEFRLPVLRAVFHCPTRRAVALNLAVSLVTLVASLVVRLRVGPQGALLPLVPVIAGLIAGSIVGAWLGASYASRISVAQLDRWVFFLLVGIGALLIAEGSIPWQSGGVPWGLAGRLPLGAFEERSDLGTLVLPMGVGSILGAFVGGLLVPWVPAGALKIGLGVILIGSAVRIFRARPHGEP